MSQKSQKKIKLFSNLHFKEHEFVTKEVVLTEVTVMKKASPYQDEKVQELGWFLFEDENENHNDTKESLDVFDIKTAKNREDVAIPEHFTSWYHATGELYLTFRERKGIIPFSSEVSKMLKAEKIDPKHDIHIPKLDRLSTNEDIETYFDRLAGTGWRNRSRLYLGNVWKADAGLFRLLLEEQKGTADKELNSYVLSPNVKNYYHRVNINNSKQVSLSSAWFITFNHFMSTIAHNENNVHNVDIPKTNEHKTLRECLDDKDFVEEINRQYDNLCFVANEYSGSLARATFYNGNTPFYFKSLNTIAARDFMLDLTPHDIKKLFELDSYTPNDPQADFFKELLVNVKGSVVGKNDIIDNWVKHLKGGVATKKEVITENNLYEYISIAQARGLSELFNATSGIEDSNVKLLGGALNTSLNNKIGEFRNKGATDKLVFLELMNILGEDYILHDIKLSHLYAFLMSFATTDLPLIGKNQNWRENLLKEGLKNFGHDKQGKTKTLQMYFELHMLHSTSLSASMLKNPNVFNADLPIRMNLDILNIEYSNSKHVPFEVEINDSGF